MYYANGSYYDPEVGLHVDASEISSIIDNAFSLFALDRNGMMCDNTKYITYILSQNVRRIKTHFSQKVHYYTFS